MLFPRLLALALALDTLFKSVQRRREGSAAPRILWKNPNGDTTEAFRARVAEGVSTQVEVLSTSDAESVVHPCNFNQRSGERYPRCSYWVIEDPYGPEGDQEDRLRVQERYKETKKEAKKVVSQAKEKAYEQLYKNLDSKEGANDIFRIAKARARRRRDLGDICFIKDEGRSITDEEKIKKRWGEYFSSLFNARDLEGHEEVKMGRNKAVGPDQIPIEAWRSLGDEGIFWLTSLFDKIFISAKMPEEWRLSDVIPIFKNKGDAQVCNYMGIKLLSHTMKLWERVIERRLRRETTVSENQFGFMLGRSSVEAIHLIRSLMEKYMERQRDLHMAFLDLEKAYDSVPRELIWKTLVDKGTPRRYIRVIRDMYDGAKTHVRTSIENMEFFPVEIGLHQGSTISPYLFALILDELSRWIQEDIPWCLIFADDIALVSESAEGLNTRLENWKDNGLRVSREKTEYLRCDFGNVEIAHNEEVDIRIGEKILQPKESFRYFGSMLHKSGRIDEDVSHRIKAAWMKWRAATGVLCDRKVPLKLKGKFYRVAIRPALLYGTLSDMIPNGVYRAELEVENIINKMREGWLRWFGHVRRRPQSAPVRRVEVLVVDGLRRRGRPKLRWEDIVKQDLKELRLSVDMTSDRNDWRARIRLCGQASDTSFWLPKALRQLLVKNGMALRFTKRSYYPTGRQLSMPIASNNMQDNSRRDLERHKKSKEQLKLANEQQKSNMSTTATYVFDIQIDKALSILKFGKDMPHLSKQGWENVLLSFSNVKYARSTLCVSELGENPRPLISYYKANYNDNEDPSYHQDDESLMRWKEQLLGAVDINVVDGESVAEPLYMKSGEVGTLGYMAPEVLSRKTY
ncbi:zinc finger CCCH domain-containing protein 18 isoform X1 [Tanacetum coccineum]|uniref:Zinc finger CCCH domain-containing protein 18 isoform X1 n=1 Tax=Tanacetum coccineum TaxID=301880 RepID=A0ABQ5DI38_9ASTR